jgi:PAS domain S-box-containing protein
MIKLSSVSNASVADIQIEDRESGDESFAAVAEHAPTMLWRGDENGQCIYLNRAQREFWGVAADQVAIFTWSSTLLPEDSDKVFGPFAEGMRERKPFKCEARYLRADGAVRILETHAVPRFNEAGAFTGMVGTNVDVTDARRAQAELSESEARLRALADNLPFGMVYQIVTGADGSERRFSFVSNRCESLNGISAETAMNDPSSLYALIEPDYRAAFALAEQQARQAFTPFEFEAPMRNANGLVRWFRIVSAPRRLSNEETAWDGVQIDIHDLKQSEERRRLVLNEMSHRIKNLLSTVIAIAAQTGRAAPSVEAFNASFQARLQALSKSHDLLLRDSSDSVDLRDVLEASLRPYASSTDFERGLTLTGGAVRLSGRAALSLSLVIHELATNAAKYGAYARDGALDVSWAHASGENSLVTLAWRERGGPRVAPPARSGFGSTLIETLISRELGGQVIITYAPDGLEADLEFSVT